MEASSSRLTRGAQGSVRVGKVVNGFSIIEVVITVGILMSLTLAVARNVKGRI